MIENREQRLNFKKYVTAALVLLLLNVFYIYGKLSLNKYENMVAEENKTYIEMEVEKSKELITVNMSGLELNANSFSSGRSVATLFPKYNILVKKVKLIADSDMIIMKKTQFLELIKEDQKLLEDFKIVVYLPRYNQLMLFNKKTEKNKYHDIVIRQVMDYHTSLPSLDTFKVHFERNSAADFLNENKISFNENDIVNNEFITSDSIIYQAERIETGVFPMIVFVVSYFIFSIFSIILVRFHIEDRSDKNDPWVFIGAAMALNLFASNPWVYYNLY